MARIALSVSVFLVAVAVASAARIRSPHPRRIVAKAPAAHHVRGGYDAEVEKVFSCPAAYGQFPHEKFCNLYYECHEYTAYVFACPYDWLFSTALGLCDLPESVDCKGLGISTPGPGVTTEGTTRGGEDPSTTDRTTTTSTTVRTTPGPFSCPAQDGDYPNPADCSTYFSCTAGVPTLMHCPDGTNFNPATGWCEVGTDFCSGSHTIDPDYTGPTEPPPFQCPPQDGLYPNPADCSTYFNCVNGNPIEMPCPGGTNFNPATSSCEIGDEFCSKRSKQPKKVRDLGAAEAEDTTEAPETTTQPIVTPSTWFVCPQPEGYFVSPYNCSVYFHCTNNLAWQGVCDAGLWFDLTHEQCDWPSQVACDARPTGAAMLAGRPELMAKQDTDETILWETSTTELESTTEAGSTSRPPVTPVNWFECDSEGVFPNPYDCHTYINCIFGNPWLLECPANFVFDPNVGTCVPPANYHCEPSTGVPTPRPTSEIFTIDPNFACGDDGFYVYEQSCHYYYQCSNQIAFLRECDANLIFYLPRKRCVSLSEVPDVTELTCQLAKSEKHAAIAVNKEKAAIRALNTAHYRKHEPAWIKAKHPSAPSSSSGAKKSAQVARPERRPNIRVSERHDAAQVRPKQNQH